MSQQTVTINGTVYDAHTGLPIKTEAPSAAAPAGNSQLHPSQSVHQVTQKSQTLNRRVVQPKNNVQARPTVQKSPAITKFAPHPVGAGPVATRTISDIGPAQHPMVTKAHQHLAQAAARQHTAATMAPKPSQVIKQEAISEAMAKAPDHTKKESKKQSKKFSRLASIGSVKLGAASPWRLLYVPEYAQSFRPRRRRSGWC